MDIIMSATSSYIMVKGTPGHAGTDVEGLDEALKGKKETFLAIIDALGFMLDGGVITKKQGSFSVCEPVGAPGRHLVLQAYLFPTDVLTLLREIAGFKVVSSAALPTGSIVWTMERH